ncbi:MAG: sigma-70 family RNA polymerase sigma factor [Clostridiales bacterium]|jgi:RNA polymerase sigma-70 factor (ECF subfamily)|nr:sigma-70 family RNA polymerase sigma factor [Clostridiales bacterium]
MEQTREARLMDWMERYSQAILRTCFVYLGRRQEAEDAMQDTFLKAWKAMDSFDAARGASEKTWLMRIAVNVCHDYHRSRWARFVDMSRSLEDLPGRYLRLEPEEETLLMDVMRLPEKQKQVILLYYYHDMTIKEAAEALGVAPSTVYQRLKKAEQTLRIKLTEGSGHENESD